MEGQNKLDHLPLANFKANLISEGLSPWCLCSQMLDKPENHIAVANNRHIQQTIFELLKYLQQTML